MDTIFQHNPLSGATVTAVPSPPAQTNPATHLLRNIGLLAGLGRQVESLTEQFACLEYSAEKQGRTCIDGGSHMMFALLAPGDRSSLRLLNRTESATDSIMSWIRHYIQSGNKPECWQTDVLLGEPQDAWARAHTLAKRVNALSRFQADHALLGPCGRICSLSWSLGDPTQAEISWQLDRSAPLERLLAELGLPEAWTQTRHIFETLLNFPVTTRSGPWSILRRLNVDGESVLRLGSSNWARSIEDDGKRRRLTKLIKHLGGDSRFAEALYKLLNAHQQGQRIQRVGRALELEWHNGQLTAAEFFLSVPNFSGPMAA